MNSLLDKVEASAKRLDVYAGQHRIGLLERLGASGTVFAYLPEAGAADFASLLMPVRREGYVSNRGLIPVFQQNLPEGFLRRQIVERFGKLLATDDFMLLALTGADPIGRQRVVPSGFALDWNKPAQLDVEALLKDDRAGALFTDLLPRFTSFGVSGALPKLLARERATLHDGDWILKSSGDDLPSLAVNEYFTMQAAAAAGLEVPISRLSDDGEVLAVQRFDIVPAAGTPLGFEDFCALLALPPERKYQGTMERIFKAIDAFAQGPQRIRAKETMIAAQIFAMAARDTDAHLKNFGLLYSGIGDVRLAPVFDMVTTLAYPQYRNDIPSIAVGGEKVAAIDKSFVRFSQERAGLSVRALRQIGERVLGALEKTATAVGDYGRAHPAHGAVCEEMARHWAEGIRMLDAFTRRRQ
jgi:serine/threonine-protein kinase HipA